MMWHHIKYDLEDAYWSLRGAGKAALAWMFGRVTHGGKAITFRGTSYRRKPAPTAPAPATETEE